jgi:hypothetical protein
LLEARGLDRCIFDGEGAGDFCCSSAIHDTVVSDKIPDHAESIM